MAELDATDREILRLLMENARRSYRDIGEQVGLSPPTISERVDRLEDMGVIQGFTLDVDRSTLVDGDAVLVEIRTRPGRAGEVADALADVEAVAHVVRTVDARVVARTYMDADELRTLVSETLDGDVVRELDVRKVVESAWSPTLGEGDLVVECVKCGKAVEGEGVTVTLDGQEYHLCCTSCESLFREEYEELRAGIEE
ncbi:Lrp/AsnC family transcriptional regulator [halophilic archaeon]|nr:Lrp/AsnC family transcriptional regulator [halophilic archaeon]